MGPPQHRKKAKAGEHLAGEGVQQEALAAGLLGTHEPRVEGPHWRHTDCTLHGRREAWEEAEHDDQGARQEARPRRPVSLAAKKTSAHMCPFALAFL